MSFLEEQTRRYAEELSALYELERAARARAEDAARGLEASYDATVRALAAALELRDDLSGRHAERVTAVALELTRAAAPELEADPGLGYGFLLHDVGKIGIPDGVLRKRGPLDSDELTLMRTHTELGERIVGGIAFLAGVACDVVTCHHEHWDGGGYPHGLSGTGIPLPARIFALADAFDAMTHDRLDRSALTLEEAIRRIRDCAGSQFDPALATTFCAMLGEAER